MYNLPDTLGPVVFDIVDDLGCKKEFSGLFGAPLPNFTYPDTTVCDNAGLLTPVLNTHPAADLTFTGTSTNGNTFSDTTGVIDPSGMAGNSIDINLTASHMGCYRDSTVTINVLASPEIDTLADESLCSGEVFEPNFTSPSQNVSYGISTTATGFGIPASDSGLTFSYVMENSSGNNITLPVNYFSFDANCTSDTFTIDLTVFNDPAIVDSLVMCPGDKKDLEVDNVNSIEWFPEDQFSDPASTVTTYTASLEDQIYVNTSTDNCSFKDTIRITRPDGEDCTPEPYSAFSPNGDGQNDTWVIPGIQNYPENEVTIYNRWGDVIGDFENYNNFDVSWDGTNNGEELPTGTYFYTIEFSNELKSQGWIKLLK